MQRVHTVAGRAEIVERHKGVGVGGRGREKLTEEKEVEALK